MNSESEIYWYKGSRPYIQAADLLALAWNTVDTIDTFSLVSRKVAYRPTRWVDASTTDARAALATLDAKLVSGEKRSLVAVQDEARTISERREFDETLLLSRAAWDEQTICCPLSSTFTIWEYVSSLQKALLTRIFASPNWWFVKLEGNADFGRPAKDIVVRFAGKKRILYRSEILLDGAVAGAVDFALRE